MLIRDAAAALSKEVTPEGFLRVRARVARAGLHEYRAAELGTPEGFAPDAVIRVYRPPAEVFDPDSMASFRGKPVTDGHPPVMVDAGNWRRYAIGHAGEVVRDGDHLAADLLIADAGGAERALAGSELSNGYRADFDFGLGLTPEGDPYDAVQRNIRGNHVALVAVGRCGDSCRIGDAGLADCNCGTIVDAAELARLREDLEAARVEHARVVNAKDGALAALAARVPDPAALDRLAAERLAVVDAARRLLGPGFDVSGLGTGDIRRAAAARVLGAERVANRDDAYVQAAFDALAAVHGPGNPLARHLAAVSPGRVANSRDALAARNRDLADAWHTRTPHHQQGEA